MMGLESSTPRGVAAVSILDFEESSDFGTCAQEPNTQVSGGAGYSYTAVAFFFKMFVIPADGVFTRRHTAECAFCTCFYSVFCISTRLPWGGAGTTDVTDGTNGGMLTFHVICSRL